MVLYYFVAGGVSERQNFGIERNSGLYWFSSFVVHSLCGNLMAETGKLSCSSWVWASTLVFADWVSHWLGEKDPQWLWRRQLTRHDKLNRSMLINWLVEGVTIKFSCELCDEAAVSLGALVSLSGNLWNLLLILNADWHRVAAVTASPELVVYCMGRRYGAGGYNYLSWGLFKHCGIV